ncbi:hypothetical protein BLA29_014611, partial [Euroglyphus maynei]
MLEVVSVNSMIIIHRLIETRIHTYMIHLVRIFQLILVMIIERIVELASIMKIYELEIDLHLKIS